MKKKVLSNHWIPEEWLAPYMDKYEFTTPDQATLLDKPEVTIEQIKDFDALYNSLHNLDKKMMDAGKNLKVVANFGAGYNNVDLAYATAIGLPVVNTGTALTDTVAELGITLMAASMRGLHRFDKIVREGRFSEVSAFLTPKDNTQTCINGSKLGVLGFGRIGKAFCKKAQGLGMDAVYWDPYKVSKEVEEEYNVEYRSFDEMLATCDVIVITAAYTAESHHLFSDETFGKMKKGSHLINIARGGFVDEAALARALRSNHLKGAGLDVFEFEPKVNEELFELDNIIMTPHIASQIAITRRAMFEEGMDGMTELFEGKKPKNLLNPAALK
jgi:glyoxylate reductase